MYVYVPLIRSNQKVKTNVSLQLPTHMHTQHMMITAKSTQKAVGGENKSMQIK